MIHVPRIKSMRQLRTSIPQNDSKTYLHVAFLERRKIHYMMEKHKALHRIGELDKQILEVEQAKEQLLNSIGHDKSVTVTQPRATIKKHGVTAGIKITY